MNGDELGDALTREMRPEFERAREKERAEMEWAEKVASRRPSHVPDHWMALSAMAITWGSPMLPGGHYTVADPRYFPPGSVSRSTGATPPMRPFTPPLRPPGRSPFAHMEVSDLMKEILRGRGDHLRDIGGRMHDVRLLERLAEAERILEMAKEAIGEENKTPPVDPAPPPSKGFFDGLWKRLRK